MAVRSPARGDHSAVCLPCYLASTRRIRRASLIVVRPMRCLSSSDTSAVTSAINTPTPVQTSPQHPHSPMPLRYLAPAPMEHCDVQIRLQSIRLTGRANPAPHEDSIEPGLNCAINQGLTHLRQSELSLHYLEHPLRSENSMASSMRWRCTSKRRPIVWKPSSTRGKP